VLVAIIIREETMHYKLDLRKDETDDRDYQLKDIVCPKCGGSLTSDLHLLFCEERHRVTEDSKEDGVDWTPYMSPVKDQGRLGSCVGFAVAAMKEYQEQKEHMLEVLNGKSYTRKEDHYDLSEAWVYWNSKKIDPCPDSEGTSIRCAMRVLHKIGIPCEAGWEYDDRFKGEPKSWANLIAKWGLIDSYWRVSGVDDLILALNDGPVVIGVACFREIFNPVNGFVPYPANPNEFLGGHAVCAVGYSEDKDLIKFKNSWSTGWGDEGYGYLPYDYIRDFMWDAWVAKDMQVTRDIIKARGKDTLI
jgi:C1A family cysteine protease